jgi:hypothetical protein
VGWGGAGRADFEHRYDRKLRAPQPGEPPFVCAGRIRGSRGIDRRFRSSPDPHCGYGSGISSFGERPGLCVVLGLGRNRPLAIPPS